MEDEPLPPLDSKILGLKELAKNKFPVNNHIYLAMDGLKEKKLYINLKKNLRDNGLKWIIFLFAMEIFIIILFIFLSRYNIFGDMGIVIIFGLILTSIISIRVLFFVRRRLIENSLNSPNQILNLAEGEKAEKYSDIVCYLAEGRISLKNKGSFSLNSIDSIDLIKMTIEVEKISLSQEVFGIMAKLNTNTRNGGIALVGAYFSHNYEEMVIFGEFISHFLSQWRKELYGYTTPLEFNAIPPEIPPAINWDFIAFMKFEGKEFIKKIFS